MSRYRIQDYAVRYDSTDAALKIGLYFNVGFPLTYDGRRLSADSIRRVRESLRLVTDETVGGSIFTSTGAKANILDVVPGTVEGKDVCVMFSLLNLRNIALADKDVEELNALEAVQATDEFTIEVDWGGNEANDLAKFFGVQTIEGYEFMTEQEVYDLLEEIMTTMDGDLTAEMAASITAETKTIMNQ